LYPLLSTENISKPQAVAQKPDLKKQLEIHWSDEAQSAHILQLGGTGEKDTLTIHSIGINKLISKQLSAGLDRFILSRQSVEETGVVIYWDSDCEYQNLAVLDRAHYPTNFSDVSNTSNQEIRFLDLT